MKRLWLALAALLLAQQAWADPPVSVSDAPEMLCRRGNATAGKSCWVSSSVFPRRCDCVRNLCPSSTIAGTTNCYICDRGGAGGIGVVGGDGGGRCALLALRTLALLTVFRVANCLTPPVEGDGVYATEQECMGEERAPAAAIDGGSYPAPTFPATACPSRSRAATVSTPADLCVHCPASLLTLYPASTARG